VEYRRTAVIKLDVPSDAEGALRETLEQFKHCANRASDWCWHGDDGYHVTSKAKAERALYDPLREETDLTANLVQKGIRRPSKPSKAESHVSNVARTRRNHTSLQTARSTTNGARRSTATTYQYPP